MKTKLLLIPLIALLVIGATVQNLTKDNIADAPASVTIAGTNLFLVLSNRTLVRVSLSNVFNALSTQSSLNVGFSNITSSGSVNATNGYKKGAFTGVSTTNTVYTTGAGGVGSVTNVITAQGGLIVSWVVTQ